MNKHISRFGLSLFVLSLTVVASAQIVDQEPQLKSLPKLEKRPASERHLFGTRMTVNVSVDAKGNVTAVNSVDGPGWVCPGIVTPELIALRTAAEVVAKKAKFAPAVVGGQKSISIAAIELEFPAKTDTARFEGVVYAGDAERNSRKDLTTLPPGRGISEGGVAGQSGATLSPQSTTSGEDSGTGGILNFKAIALPRPTYPAAARAVRASGSVSVQVLIGEDGSMLSAEATKGHPLLRSVSRIAACGAKFAPTLLDGKPVNVSGIITYNYVP